MSVSGDSVVVPPVQVSELRHVMSVLSCQHFQMSERCRVGLGGGTTNFLPEQTMTPVTVAPATLAGNASPPIMVARGRNHRFDPYLSSLQGDTELGQDDSEV